MSYKRRLLTQIIKEARQSSVTVFEKPV